MDQTLIQEILEVVEQAAIASARLTGLGKKDEADAAAVEAMRDRMGKIEMKGKIVIGEGERDEAPMLYIGEEVGSGKGPGVDFAVDPCEGTNLCANNQRGSMAVLAASDSGGLFNAPDFYMNKLAAPPAAKGKVDIRNTATENLKILSNCLDLSIDELTVLFLLGAFLTLTILSNLAILRSLGTKINNMARKPVATAAFPSSPLKATITNTTKA